MGGGLIRSIGGWEKVAELKRGREKWAYDERVLGSSQFVERVLTEAEKQGGQKKVEGKFAEAILLTLVEKIGSRLGLTRAELIGRSRRRKAVQGRNLVIFEAVRGYGMNLNQVAKVLNVSPQSVLRGLEKGQEGVRQRGWTLGDSNE